LGKIKTKKKEIFDGIRKVAVPIQGKTRPKRGNALQILLGKGNRVKEGSLVLDRGGGKFRIQNTNPPDRLGLVQRVVLHHQKRSEEGYFVHSTFRSNLTGRRVENRGS